MTDLQSDDVTVTFKDEEHGIGFIEVDGDEYVMVEVDGEWENDVEEYQERVRELTRDVLDGKQDFEDAFEEYKEANNE